MIPLLSYAPPNLLAKQWLLAYQFGPKFVPPLVVGGTVCNGLLAYYATSRTARALYIVAALLVWSIAPFTIFYMEPGINGAGKWKVATMLKDEGFKMEENGRGVPDVHRHTATQSARQWADKTDMKDIVRAWTRINALRYMITFVSAFASGYATCIA